jgi:Swt1-like HEPN
MNPKEQLLLFGMSTLTLNRGLDAVEDRLGIDLGRPESKPGEGEQYPSYYAQFPAVLRQQAAEMGSHYETLYCLENSIRDLVTVKMDDAHGTGWWNAHVPQPVKDTVENNRKREAEAGISMRSTDPIDYTNFGELLVIIEHNWQTFSDTFNNQKALRRVLSGLNMLRAPIAHCASLAADEVTRLELGIRDYYRLME